MPTYAPIYTDFFWRLLTEDVDELLGRFQQTGSVRYEDFSAIWREMGFSDMFLGIPVSSELKRFCRVALATAVKYFLPPYSFQIQVGGLYLMFAFYHTQLAAPPVKIRLALKDWEHVQTFLQDSVNSKHCDVVYILQKLIATKAFHYTAMPHFLAFRKQRKPRRDPVCAEFLVKSRRVQELVSADLMEEVTNIHSHYEEMKEAVAEENHHIVVVRQDFPDRLSSCVGEFVSWQDKNFPAETRDEDEEPAGDEGNQTEAESSRRAQLLASIKTKSYGKYQQVSKSRRHRRVTAVDSSGSGLEPSQETSTAVRRRPASLRARTWKKLTVQEEKSTLQSWLETSPKKPDRPNRHRVNPAIAFH
ncbi:snRNA-activating protein complex subunit 1-like [Diretmus argenteus]